MHFLDSWTLPYDKSRAVQSKKQNILHQASIPFKQKTHVACCAPLKMSVLLALLHGFANLVLVLTKNPELEIDTSMYVERYTQQITTFY